MSGLFPLRSSVDESRGDPRVLPLEGEDADRVFGALSSAMARQIVVALSEEPRTASEVADAVGTSIQNARYHLEKLHDAGVVSVVDQWYSSRGREMDVYAPADGALVVTPDPSRGERIVSALKRLVAGTGLLGLLSVGVQLAADRLAGATADGATTPQAGGDGQAESFDTAARATQTAADAAGSGGIPPGLLFFLGGAVVLVAVVAWLYVRGPATR